VHESLIGGRVRRGRALGAAAIFSLCLAGPAWAGEIVSSDMVRQNLYSTCFVNERVGWAVGDLGRIFYTTDGAKTWEVQNAGTKRPFVSVHCLDESNAVIAGQVGEIARTQDAGKTWSMHESGTDRQLLSVSFVDAKVGIAVGDFGTIVRTEDGGATWAKIPVPVDTQLPEEYFGIIEPGDIVLYAASWGTPDIVTVVGEFGVILTSKDRGLTFQQQPSPVATTLFGVFLADSQRGWAVGMEAVMLATNDGGATWVQEKVATPPGFSLALYDLEIRGNLGWAVGNSGFLLTTADAGGTWKLVEVPPQMGSYWFREISLLPNGKGFIVGSTGMVLSLDGAKFTASKQQL